MTIDLVPARRRHLGPISLMSRALIERGLGWRWRPQRLARTLARDDTLCVVAQHHQAGCVGFALMRYDLLDGHLLLFAVDPAFRRQGLGSRLLDWHEKAARLAGIERLHLEVRATNTSGRAFYKSRGWREVAVVRGYYDRREDAVRMLRELIPPRQDT